MKKKTFIVQLLNSKKPNRKSFTQVEDANFYSNDTDASLVFIPHEDAFDFQSAKVVMYNRSDESLVERDAVVTTENGRKVASYELPAEIISHWGEWTAQPVFISGGEIYSGSIVFYSVFRYLMHDRPAKLTEMVTVTEFIQQSQALVNDMAQKETQRVTQEQSRQSAEAVRVQAESERSEKYASYAQQFNDVITDLSEEKDYHSLPEISAARGGHDTLGERLDDTTAQLAQTAKKVNVLNHLPQSLSGIAPNSLIAIPENTIGITWDIANWEVGSLASATGAKFSSSIRIRTKEFLPIDSGAKYLVLLETSNDGDSKNESTANIFEYRADGSFISSTGFIANESLFTPATDTTKIKMLVRNVVDNYTIPVEYIKIAKPILSKVY